MFAITQKEITKNILLSDAAILWASENMEYLNNVEKFQFFGTSTKMQKGAEKYELWVMYLQPHNKIARETICLFAEKAGCAAPCLIDSGLLGKTPAQNAATKRTILMLLRPEFFAERIQSEIVKKEKRAERSRIPCAFRLNGTSDLDFSAIIAANPNSTFWDYTKILARVSKNTLSNYNLTFSGSMYSKQSRAALEKAIARKHQIAIAFNSANTKTDSFNVPESAAGIALKTFDDSDARFLDSASAIGTLSRKGSNKAERETENENAQSFFVTLANKAAFIDIIARAA
jgi:hypothetical protein